MDIVTRNNKVSWLLAVWEVLHRANDEGLITEPEWDEVCTAMAWVAEEFGIEPRELAD